MKAIAVAWLGLILLVASVGADPNKATEPNKAVEKKAVQWKMAETKPPAESAADISCGVLAGETPATVKIEKALDEPTALEFIDAPLTDVIEYLKARHQIEVQFDNTALEGAGVAKDAQITRNLTGAKLRCALPLVLRDLELAYVIRDDVLFITTKATADRMMETRVYAVGDLLRGKPRVSLQAAAGTLSEIIQSTVEPPTWSEVGGAGSIKYWPGGGALVISQTYSIHREIQHLLAAMRKLRAQHPAEAAEQAAGDRANEYR